MTDQPSIPGPGAGRAPLIGDDDDDNNDVDQPWFEPQPPAKDPPDPPVFSTVHGTLTQQEIPEYAGEMLRKLFTDRPTRLNYYNLSRSWHDNRARNGYAGGDYEARWLALLAESLTGAKSGTLNTNDFADIHRWLFLTLRRVFLAVTGHDPHPHPDEPLPPPARRNANGDFVASVSAKGRRPTGFRSFHWVPNDTSAPLGTWTNEQLGVSTTEA